MHTFALLLLLTCAAPLAAEEPWPQFLGPACDGASRQPDLPLTWSETKNVRWKTAIHDRGHSSPVVWGQQIWLTTAADDGKQLFAVCVDRDSGRIIHDIPVFDVEKPEPIAELNTYASPTPVVEAGRIYVHFGTYGTACLDTATGKTLWSRRDLHCDHFRGPASSAFVYKELLVLTFDGIDVQYVTALNKRTGETVWKTDRSTDYGNAPGDNRKAYSTPIVIDAGGPQLISCGAYAADAYVPDTGREIWKVRYPGGFSNVSRPLYGQGLLFLNTGFGRPEIWAVRPDGHGDISRQPRRLEEQGEKPAGQAVERPGGGPAVLRRRQRRGQLPGGQDRRDGLAGADPRVLLGLAALLARPDLLLRPRRQDDGNRCRAEAAGARRQPA